MLLVRARVGPSKIHGLGLISQEFIPAGTVVWELKPGFDLEITEAQIQTLSAAAIEQVLIYSDGDYDPERGVYYLCMDDARFTNHSDHPNTVNARDGLVTIADRDIHPGDEITWAYQFSAPSDRSSY